MCNEVARRIALDLIRVDFSQLRIPLRFSEGTPNLAALDTIRITDPTLIVRAGGEAVSRRWSWPGQSGRPVYNYRSEGRAFAHTADAGRCLIPVDGFYEFTTPVVAPGGPKPTRKDKWLFEARDAAFLCIAGYWRRDPEVGEAFTMLTCAPGPDIAPYHDRQVVLMPRASWGAWVDGTAPAEALIAPTPAGTLRVTAVTR